MQYEILTESGAAEFSDKGSWGADEKLEKKVQEYIAQGWRPQGGVSISLRKGDNSSIDYMYAFQAMVKD